MRNADGFNDTIRCRCDKTLKQRLQRIADSDDRELSDLVRAVLTRYAYAEEYASLEGKPTGSILQLLKEAAPNDGNAAKTKSLNRRN